MVVRFGWVGLGAMCDEGRGGEGRGGLRGGERSRMVNAWWETA